MSSSSAQKLQVYLNEYNIPLDNAVYLPLVSGQLQAYAMTKDVIREHYQFMPFIFIRNQLEQILSLYENPAVAAFSGLVWNTNLSLAVARRVKERFPNCLIVFGGAQVPFDATDFFWTYPFIDVTVRGEGEQTFTELLERFLETRDFRSIPGISYRDPDTGECLRNDKERAVIKDLDMFPSPYLEGLFNELMPMDTSFQAIIETNRGCPFACTYCFWGQGGLGKQYRFFSLDRVENIIRWCGLNKIPFVACADSNFGMLKRDLEIANYFVQTKVKYGFPEKIMATYGKNAEDTIYEVGKLLNKHGLTKGITLSTQSNDPETLRNVRRKSIKLSTYRNLQRKYNIENIPVYTELILGLPGETYHSFLRGIEEILQAGLKNQLFVYICQVYPNTELARQEYQDKFKISTIRIPVNEIHCSVHVQETVVEYEDIVVSTASMPVEDWKRAVILSWVMQLLHGLKLGFYILAYLVDRYHIKYTDFLEYISLLEIKSDRVKILKSEVSTFYRLLDSILQGNPRARVMPDFGSIYWGIKEASYLSISEQKDDFYDEMSEVVKGYLSAIGVDYDTEELEEVIEYQRARIPNYKSVERAEYRFQRNIPEYFDKYFLESRPSLSLKPQRMNLSDIKDYGGNKKDFAREILLFGRKTDRMLYPVSWSNAKSKSTGEGSSHS